MTRAGAAISAGCMLMDITTWNSFIGNFNTPEQKNNTIGVILSRTYDSPQSPEQKITPLGVIMPPLTIPVDNLRIIIPTKRN